MLSLLALEDGSIYSGRAFGSLRPAGAEVVFNTSMTGYQEILTDPSYHGQIVVFTAPHVGNYGIHDDLGESVRPRAAGVIVRDACEIPSHPASRLSLGAWLREHEVFGLAGVDTRSLTRRIRDRGTMRGWLTTLVSEPSEAVAAACRVPPMREIDAVDAVTTREGYSWTGAAGSDRPVVAVLDCGVKYGILRALAARGCRPAVMPAGTPVDEVLACRPAGLVLSNGPGDPEALTEALPRIRALVEQLPTLAICLGHQLVALAFGAHTVRLPFGHHGGNHPVRDLHTGQVLITAQNHNYAVDPQGLPKELEVSHLNLNDGTIEGLRHRSLPLWSVQFHPEASPGPHEAAGLFDVFADWIGGSPLSIQPARAGRADPGIDDPAIFLETGSSVDTIATDR